MSRRPDDMPRSIPNTTLADAYTDATTFGIADVFSWGFFTVANNPAFVQLLEGVAGQGVPQDEVYCPPATYPIAQGRRPVAGIRAHNAVVGSNAQFFGSLFYPEEPGIQAGTPFTGVVDPSGATSNLGELANVPILATVSTGAATEAAPLTIASLPAMDYSGREILFQLYSPELINPLSANFGISLWDMTNNADLGRMGFSVSNASGFLSAVFPNPMQVRVTPAAGSIIIAARMWRTAGTFQFVAGVGGAGAFLPGYLRALTAA